jgi:acylphosphatase
MLPPSRTRAILIAMTVTEERKTVNLRIRGRVQGVGYRAWVQARAAQLGLAGWVRNRMDGTVEALVSGPAAAVERLLAAARTGPSPARVAQVDTMPADPPTDTGFHQLPTV